jgi:hypothetical protein
MEQLNTVQPVEAEKSELRDYLFREISSCAYRTISRESPVLSDERTPRYTPVRIASAPESYPPLSTGQQVLPVEF